MELSLVFQFFFTLVMFQRGNTSSVPSSRSDNSNMSRGKIHNIVNKGGNPTCELYVETKGADCSARHLNEVPQDLPTDVQSLSLSFNNITFLRNVTFYRYLHLLEIDLLSNGLTSIESLTFQPLNNLQELTLALNPALFRCYAGLVGIKGAQCGPHSFDFGVVRFPMTLEKLDLAYNKLTFIQLKHCGENNWYVDLSHNNITKLSPENFAMDCSANKLNMYENPIQMIDPHLIAGLRVKELSVGRYPLSVDVLKNLTLGASMSATLDTLTIEYASISHIPPDVFAPLHNKSLQHLSLSGNPLNFASFVFSNLTFLSSLDISSCSLDRLDPNYFTGMMKLHSINLLGNSIRSVNPSNTTWNIDLHKLDFSLWSCKEITQFAFRGLNTLTEFTMAFYESSFIKNLTFELVKLEKLILRNNPFKDVVLKSPGLKYFRSHVPEKEHIHFVYSYDFQNSPLIEILCLDNGGLGSHAHYLLNLDFISCLKRLEVLDLSFNSIGTLSSYVFRNVSSLQSLDMQSNSIWYIESNAFSGLTSVQLINLKNNKISFLPENIFKDMKALTSLYLDANALIYLDKDLFIASRSLTNLSLANNRLIDFNHSTFDPIYSSLKSLDISGNVIVCNCASLPLLVKKFNTYLINKDKTLCATSRDTLVSLRGKPIEMISEPSQYCSSNVLRYSFITSAVLVLCVIFVICYHHRWLLKYKIFLLKLAILGYQEVHDALDKDDFEYNINIMFMENDQEWTEENFRPALEERLPDYGRIAFGDDELRLGMHYFDAVYYNVENSFKTVLLLSRAAVQDHIFMTKLRIAMNHVTDTETDNLILVFREDIPDQELPHLVRLHLSGQGAYLSWEEDEEGQEYFWNKLKKHMNVNLKVNHMIPAD